MNPLDFLLAMNDIDAAAVDEAIELMHGGTVGNDTREVINLNKHRRKTAAPIRAHRGDCGSASGAGRRGLRH